MVNTEANIIRNYGIESEDTGLKVYNMKFKRCSYHLAAAYYNHHKELQPKRVTNKNDSKK